MPAVCFNVCIFIYIMICTLILLVNMVKYKYGRGGCLPIVDDVETYKDGGIVDISLNTIDPESDVMKIHTLGKDLSDITKHMEDPLSLDELIVVQKDTKSGQFHRSFTDANVDGPQLEGMVAPLGEFDDSFMQIQEEKNIHS